MYSVVIDAVIIGELRNYKDNEKPSNEQAKHSRRWKKRKTGPCEVTRTYTDDGEVDDAYQVVAVWVSSACVTASSMAARLLLSLLDSGAPGRVAF